MYALLATMLVEACRKVKRIVGRGQENRSRGTQKASLIGSDTRSCLTRNKLIVPVAVKKRILKAGRRVSVILYK